ncbi:MAG: SsrA-binding protein SmpB [Candidatus Jidaibacter sp.]|jgi:SsrA-binding protein|nr:SsrA-binding protein SmpB [Candidatus Jidaibacter sp.]
MARRPQDYKKVIVYNRKAKYDYFIDETLEAGIVLVGSEAKSLRAHDVNINDAYVDHENGAMMLINSYIPEYDKAATAFNHSPRRTRKLLLHKRQIKKLIGMIKTKGVTIVPLSVYFNNKNIAKLEIAVVRGKKEYDKRESIKQADWKREKARIMAS